MKVKRLKMWIYFIGMFGMGITYLSFVDNWQVYAKPLQDAKSWYESMREKNVDISSKQHGQLTLTSETEGNGEQWTLSYGNGILEDLNPDGAAGENSHAQGGDTSDVHGEDSDEEDGSRDQEAWEEGTGEATENGQETPVGEPADRAPEFVTVEDDYFSDALFIGDSRTVGMYEYGGLEEISTFYASTGLTIYKLFDAEIVSVEGRKGKITVEEALQQNTFSKIYLMIGINEMGTGTVETFAAKYQEAVEHLKELQPGAVIYLQGIMKVTTERSEKGDYINNEGIEARNQAIAQLADNVSVFYLDVNPLICDETGGIVDSYTFDGVHLKAKYIDIWKEFLKAHAISL